MEWDNSSRGSGFGDGPEFRMPNINFPPIKRSTIWWLVIVIIAIWVATGIYIIGPDQKGVVLRFGKMTAIKDPGPHWRIPWPVEKVEKPKVTEVKRVEVGFRTIDPGPPARYRNIPAESLMLTGDENIVDIDMIVQYQITDPEKFLFRIRDPRFRQQDLEGTVMDTSEAALRQVVGSRKIDDVLTEKKYEIQEDIKALLQQIFERYDAGLKVIAVQLQDVHPPEEVWDAFKDVASAREDKSRLINEAQGYWNAILPETRGKKEKILREAEAYRESKIKEAIGDAERFEKILAQYVKAKNVTRKRLYIEMMEEVLPKIEKYIIEPGSGATPLPLLPLGKIPIQNVE
jgi:membrane protease subunit HflK